MREIVGIGELGQLCHSDRFDSPLAPCLIAFCPLRFAKTIRGQATHESRPRMLVSLDNQEKIVPLARFGPGPDS